MKQAIALSALLMTAAAAFAAGPKMNFIDHSNDRVMSSADAIAVMKEVIPAKVWKLYPASRWVFSSQVEGGLTTAGACVVTARVMLLPLTPTLKAVLFRPSKTATAFDAIAKSDDAQCKALAKDKLKEATEAVVSDLVKT
ncbi:MAG: hypothetical protein KGL18_13540 [Burkholderiales bacterium]|nr:hypothetical protein [Burkholderiales bacterium]MDE1926740.1 hypothetical protein [Burkholderiales bacterium]MDE2158765.1 hypothetical protein [Burkholderiales bacterium]MDE2503982.1 hypothetical protein [Burkholderiales bacterium]